MVFLADLPARTCHVPFPHRACNDPYPLHAPRFGPFPFQGEQERIRTVLPGLILIPYWLAAQHRGYDFAAVIVVHPHRLNSAVVEPRLRITLLDTNNLPAMINGQE